MRDKIKTALEGIIRRFESGDIPEAMSLAMFPSFDIPSAKWSFLNRLLVVIHGTADARGFRQWKQAGRHVKKGAKAFHITAPSIRKRKETDDKGDKKEVAALVGFVPVAVFRVENTEGEPLDYEQLELPALPLMEVAKAWGIDTRPMGGQMGFYGRFTPGSREIALASPEECVFFHELAHAAHNKFRPLKGGQHWNQEIVAELAAAVLCRLVGKSGDKHLGHNFRYIARYAEDADRDPLRACIEVISDVERVLNLILVDALVDKVVASR